MSVSYSDSYGQVVDSGVAVQPTARTNVEVEFHNANEIDTASKLTVAQLAASHVPHRPASSPR